MDWKILQRILITTKHEFRRCQTLIDFNFKDQKLLNMNFSIVDRERWGQRKMNFVTCMWVYGKYNRIMMCHTFIGGVKLTKVLQWSKIEKLYVQSDKCSHSAVWVLLLFSSFYPDTHTHTLSQSLYLIMIHIPVCTPFVSRWLHITISLK